MERKVLYDKYGSLMPFRYKGDIRLSDWDGGTLVNCPSKEEVSNQKSMLAFDFWLCVDEDGREQIMTNSYGLPPTRSTAPDIARRDTLTSVNDNIRAKHCGIWVMQYTSGMFCDSGPWANGPEVAQCPMPSGSIRRLIGRNLTWDDEPVLLQRCQFAKKVPLWKSFWGWIRERVR